MQVINEQRDMINQLQEDLSVLKSQFEEIKSPKELQYHNFLIPQELPVCCFVFKVCSEQRKFLCIF